MSFDKLGYDVSSHLLRNYLSPRDQRNMRLVSKNMNERMRDSLGTKLFPYTFTVYILDKTVYVEKFEDGEIFNQVLQFPTSEMIEFLTDNLSIGLFSFKPFSSVTKIVCHGHLNRHGNMEGKFICDIYQPIEDISYDDEGTFYIDEEEIILPIEVFEGHTLLSGKHLSEIVNILIKEGDIPEEHILSYISFLIDNGILLSEGREGIEFIDNSLKTLLESSTLLLADEEIVFKEVNGIPSGNFSLKKQKDAYFTYLDDGKIEYEANHFFFDGEIKNFSYSTNVFKYMRGIRQSKRKEEYVKKIKVNTIQEMEVKVKEGVPKERRYIEELIDIATYKIIQMKDDTIEHVEETSYP